MSGPHGERPRQKMIYFTISYKITPPPLQEKVFVRLKLEFGTNLMSGSFQDFSGRTNSGHSGRMFLKFSETP